MTNLGIEFLPYSLSNALEYLKKDEVVKNSLGGCLLKLFKSKGTGNIKISAPDNSCGI